MSTLGERIRIAREQKGYLQKELADLIGVKSSGVISNWEKDLNKPDAEKIVKICEVLEITASSLLNYYGKNDFELDAFEKSFIKKYRDLDPHGKEVVNFILDHEAKRKEQLEAARLSPAAEGNGNLPARIISYFQRLASAGNGQVVFDGIPVERIPIPDIPEYRRVSYAIGVNGHSMEPLYSDGDILLIEPTCTLDIGEIGIFIVGEQAFVKKLGNGELISLNKDYKNIPLTEDSKCMGRVVDKIKA